MVAGDGRGDGWASGEARWEVEWEIVDLQVVDGGGQGKELGKFWGRRKRNFSGMREVDRGMVEEEIGTASQ